MMFFYVCQSFRALARRFHRFHTAATAIVSESAFHFANSKLKFECSISNVKFFDTQSLALACPRVAGRRPKSKPLLTPKQEKNDGKARAGRVFLVTFTLPKELRSLAFQQQRTVYDLLICCSWNTVKTFAQNDSQLQGKAGAIAVLHTHSRRLDFHPHVHLVMPAAAIDTEKRLWRTKRGKKDRDKNKQATCSITRP